MAASLPLPVRLLLSLLAATAAILLAASYYNYQRSMEVKTVLLQNKAAGIAQTIEALARKSPSRTPEDLQSLIASWPEDPHLFDLTVFDRNGVIIAHRDPARLGKEDAASLFLIRQVLAEQQIRFRYLKGQPPAAFSTGAASGLPELSNPAQPIPPRFEAFLPLHLGGFDGEGPRMAGDYQPRFKVLQVQLLESAAGDVSRAALWQLFLIGLVLLGTLTVTAYLAQTLRRYFALEARAREQARMASLGQVATWVAHEVRNPLGAIKGLLQLVQETIEERDPDGQSQRYCETAVRESERLERFVGDLLAYSRLPHPAVAEWPLDHLVQEITALLEPELRRQDAAIVTQIEPPGLIVRADRDQMHRLLLNLIQNALAAMPSGGDIHLRALSSPTEEGLSIILEDEGIGLPPGEEHRLFEPFFTTREKGSGLGLALCRDIVSRHGGTIRAEDAPGGGARFIVNLPEKGEP
ncbi:hypothetical protein GTO91_06755 [Heliobacterium undosum]|uniref:histidine kinase n=1 Tax=Heliomicrobium undosum TaxID=121734 RepID=A0A845KZW8_9FIRM|nr:ATP-binding protein [Heliomicrobium undosum]MZP29403.1 hypothetical protein [Heliomicrobium undosum]